jgi:hypothetical protein
MQSYKIVTNTDMGRVGFAPKGNLLVRIEFMKRFLDGTQATIHIRYLTALFLGGRSCMLQRHCPIRSSK